MATSILAPAACPMCGWDWSANTLPEKQFHLLNHVAITGKLTAEAWLGPRDQSADW